jgi:serine/threonine protein kinase
MRPGDQIRGYVLDQCIGRGGMGEVWRAYQKSVRRRVAIKIIREGGEHAGMFRKRFAREAEAMAGLDHPHIVPVRDYFVAGETACLVLGLIDGGSLEGRGAFPLDVALRISREVLDALNYAHQCGVIHRDIKPSNILLDQKGHAYITDFGIALVAGTERITRLSRVGTAVGTPEYMSPEQIATPDDIDHRTDVYSFGCVLYEMLSGQPPFGSRDNGTTEFELMQAHVQRSPVPIRQRNSAIDKKTEAVLQCALAKDRDARFAGCGDMALALMGQRPIPGDHAPQIRLAHLLFSFHGRLNRSRFFAASLAVAAYYSFIAVLVSSSTVADNSLAISTAILILLGGWVALAIGAKRLHDRNRPAWLLLTSLLVVPIAWLVFELWIAAGTAGENHYGPDPSAGAV